MGATHAALFQWIRLADPGRHAGDAVLVLNQVCNDYLCLSRDLLCGRGRSAMRHARALIESTVSFMDVFADDAMAERYQAHAVIGHRKVAALQLPLRRLQGGPLKSARHAQRTTLRDTENVAAEALERYGPKFSQVWHPADMRQRMSRLGLDDDEYEFYAVASDHVHSAAVSGESLMRERGEGEVMRLGPAFALAPLAYLYGVRFMSHAVNAYNEEHPHTAGHDLTTELAALEAAWPQYRDVLTALDDETWPDERPLLAMAVCCVGPGGERRWFVEDLVAGQVAEVDPPSEDDVTPEGWGALSRVEKRLRDEGKWDAPQSLNMFGLIPVPVVDLHLPLPPKPKWLPSAAILHGQLQPLRVKDERGEPEWEEF